VLRSNPMNLRSAILLGACAFYPACSMNAQFDDPQSAHSTREAAPLAQTGSLEPMVIVPGTPLSVHIEDHLPMRLGEPVRARTLYPVYSENKLVLAKGTLLEGKIIALTPDHRHRLDSRLRADFTPFRIPTVQFSELVLTNGVSIPISVGTATDGAPVFRLVPDAPRKGGFVRQQFDMVSQMVKDRIAVITGPDKRDRLIQLLYTQLPYHPQRVEKDTSWTVEIASPVSMPLVFEQPGQELPPIKHVVELAPTVADSTGKPADTAPWLIQAYLNGALSSGSARLGQPVQAVVAEPIINSDKTLAVPQGAILEGSVVQVRRARRFGRAGVLRFDFRQLSSPEGRNPENVQTSLVGVDALGGRALALDSEGKVKPKPQDKLIVPLILFSLAGRPLDRDRGDNAFGKDAVASNSLGVIGFLVGTAGGWRNVAAGIGYYGSALSIYNRWIKRGSETSFPRYTRIVLQTTARRSDPLKSPLH
jgi:hypothetical protein